MCTLTLRHLISLSTSIRKISKRQASPAWVGCDFLLPLPRFCRTEHNEAFEFGPCVFFGWELKKVIWGLIIDRSPLPIA